MCKRSISSRLFSGRCWRHLFVNKVLLAKLGFLRDDHRPLNSVLQFPNITHPRLLLQLLDGAWRNSRDLLVHSHRELVNEMLHQHGYIFTSLAKRREFDMKYIQTVKKIRSECAFFDHVLPGSCWSRRRIGNQP